MNDLRPVATSDAIAASATAAAYLVPALVASLGDAASWRYVEFFTANIRNPNTRRAYARACNRFFAWCEQRGLPLAGIRPHDVASYIEHLQDTAAAPSVKQSLAAVRMLFDWLVVGQVMPVNPAAAVRGPKRLKPDVVFIRFASDDAAELLLLAHEAAAGRDAHGYALLRPSPVGDLRCDAAKRLEVPISGSTEFGKPQVWNHGR